MSFWENNKGTFKAAGLATAKGIGRGTKAVAKGGYKTYQNHKGGNSASQTGADQEGESSSPSVYIAPVPTEQLKSLPPPPKRNVGTFGVPALGERSKYQAPQPQVAQQATQPAAQAGPIPQQPGQTIVPQQYGQTGAAPAYQQMQPGAGRPDQTYQQPYQQPSQQPQPQPQPLPGQETPAYSQLGGNGTGQPIQSGQPGYDNPNQQTYSQATQLAQPTYGQYGQPIQPQSGSPQLNAPFQVTPEAAPPYNQTQSPQPNQAPQALQPPMVSLSQTVPPPTLPQRSLVSIPTIPSLPSRASIPLPVQNQATQNLAPTLENNQSPIVPAYGQAQASSAVPTYNQAPVTPSYNQATTAESAPNGQSALPDNQTKSEAPRKPLPDPTSFAPPPVRRVGPGGAALPTPPARNRPIPTPTTTSASSSYSAPSEAVTGEAPSAPSPVATGATKFLPDVLHLTPPPRPHRATEEPKSNGATPVAPTPAVATPPPSLPARTSSLPIQNKLPAAATSKPEVSPTTDLHSLPPPPVYRRPTVKSTSAEFLEDDETPPPGLPQRQNERGDEQVPSLPVRRSVETVPKSPERSDTPTKSTPIRPEKPEKPGNLEKPSRLVETPSHPPPYHLTENKQPSAPNFAEIIANQRAPQKPSAPKKPEITTKPTKKPDIPAKPSMPTKPNIPAKPVFSKSTQSKSAASIEDSLTTKPVTPSKPHIPAKPDMVTKPPISTKPTIPIKPGTPLSKQKDDIETEDITNLRNNLKKIGVPLASPTSNSFTPKLSTPPPPPKSRNLASPSSQLTPKPTLPAPPPPKKYNRAAHPLPPPSSHIPEFDLELSSGWFADLNAPLPRDFEGLNYSTSMQMSNSSSKRSLNLRLKDLAIIKYDFVWQGSDLSTVTSHIVEFQALPIATKPISKQDLVVAHEKYGPHVASWCTHNFNKQVGSGECWDLAHEALQKGCGNHAFVSTYYHHGYPILRLKDDAVLAGPYDEIRQGDIIQFTDCNFSYPNGMQQKVGAPNHTSVVLENVLGELQVAEQNVNGVRHVVAGKYNLRCLVSGEVTVYRPVDAEWAGIMERTIHYSMGEAAAPLLSTYQDEDTFEFAKVTSASHDRAYLGPSNAPYNELIASYYCLDELVAYLRQKKDDLSTPKYRNITLQFPDELIADSAAIVFYIQQKLGLTDEPSHQTNGTGEEASDADQNQTQRVWILADTSYSPCCVDEVAAEHVKSDLVIHFGDACLNPVDKVPVAYVLGKPHINHQTVIEQFAAKYTKEDKVLIMSDAAHVVHLKPLYDALKVDFPNLMYADIHAPCSGDIIGYKPELQGSDAADAHKLTSLRRRLVGTASSSISEVLDLRDWDLFHVSMPSTARHLQLSTQFNSVNVYEPTKGLFSNRAAPNLMRRYRNVHVARTAGTIGLLVNTLSLEHTKSLINVLAKKIKDSGKKHYIFVVGKPNVAKLANFAGIDVWCILGCDQQGIIIDQTSEYFKPIVTPYELNLALSEEAWTGAWVTSFEEVLKQMLEKESLNDDKSDKSDKSDIDSDEDEAPEFDPVTGRFVSTSRPLRRMRHLQIKTEEETPTENRVAQRLSASAVVLKDTVSTSAMHLQNREWTGLGSDFQDGDDSPAVLETGRGGVARGFEDDVVQEETK